MPTATVDGATIFYREQGAGTPLVLVHGFPLDGRIFQAQLERLSDRCRVIVPDLPGFGQSTLLAGGYTMQSLAGTLRAFLSKIDALPCVLGGLSMGGYVALPFARSYPNDLKGLMLIDTRSPADTAEARENRDRMAEVARARGSPAVAEMMFPKMLAESTVHESPPVATTLRQIMESQGVEGIRAALGAIRDRDDFTPLLPEIRTPTLILVGEFDAITPPAAAEQMHAGLPASWLTVIPDSGHISTMEQPAAVNRAMAAFLQELD